VPRLWTSALSMLCIVAMLQGCATRKETLLPHNGRTMLDLWNAQTGRQGAARAETHELQRRPLVDATLRVASDSLVPYTRSAANEIYRQFRRLPNPDLVMFVFPHVVGASAVPVPGYSTVFALYERVHYALPGERTEDY
jgi:conjugative transfer region lipoprotein (TIGR03751 family)